MNNAEKLPVSSDLDNNQAAQKYPSFREHEKQQQHNKEVFSTPSLKNADLNSVPESIRPIARKIQNGETLQANELMYYIKELGYGNSTKQGSNLKDFLIESGVDHGAPGTFDVQLGGYYYDAEGDKVEMPFSISFLPLGMVSKNEYTRIDFYKEPYIDKEGIAHDGQRAVAARGLQEGGYDVGYSWNNGGQTEHVDSEIICSY